MLQKAVRMSGVSACCRCAFLCPMQVIIVFLNRCVCNIDCSGYSFNPVCASDGSSYNNPCFVREASCIKQEQIDIRHLGHCTGKSPSVHQEHVLNITCWYSGSGVSQPYEMTNSSGVVFLLLPIFKFHLL